MHAAPETPHRHTSPGTWTLIAFALALGAGLPARATADEGGSTPVTDAEARRAIAEFEKAFRARGVTEKAAAVDALGASVHPKVGARLLRLIRPGREPEITAAVFRALTAQGELGEKDMRKVWKWLQAEAEQETNRLERGDPAILVDRLSGEPDTTSDEGRLRLAALEARSAMLREAVHCVRHLSKEAPEDPEAIAVFLQDPHDDLVIETLAALAAWKATGALPALLDLYRMYPTPRSWETGDVVDVAGTNATAKARWMVRFGHPGKQRARPEVYDALQAALRAITDRAFDSPEALDGWIQQETKLRGKRRRAA